MPKTKKTKKKAAEYCKPNCCLSIQWSKLYLRDGKPACSYCGEPAEQILGVFGEPCWAHATTEAAQGAADCEA